MRLVIAILIIIPFVAQLVVLPWVNFVHPVILGLFPFLHFWLLIWMILTPVFTYAVYLIQKARGEIES